MFWAPCSSGEGKGGWGASGGMGGVPPHTHACACMHIYTCIEIENGHRHGGIHVYHVYNMFNMHVRACVHVHTCACMHEWDTSPHTHTHPHPHPPICHPPRGVHPQNHLKFDNTSTYQDISIPFEDLKSVKNSPPMSGCVVWWVAGWGWWVGSG